MRYLVTVYFRTGVDARLAFPDGTYPPTVTLGDHQQYEVDASTVKREGGWFSLEQEGVVISWPTDVIRVVYCQPIPEPKE